MEAFHNEIHSALSRCEYDTQAICTGFSPTETYTRSFQTYVKPNRKIYQLRSPP